MPRRLLLAALLVAAPLHSALAADLSGEWARDDGHGRVRFAPCGDSLCGIISARSDPNAAGKIGQKVFYDMKPDSEDSWRGSAFNPDDGRVYTGKMSLAGAHLTTAGCVLGGIICKTVTWSKVK